MSRLFKRIVKVTAYRSKPGGGFFEYVDAIEITDLRVQFAIEKHTGKQANTCNITITNANPDTRAWLQQDGLHVKLDAGYDGELRHLYAGDVLPGSGKSERVGTDWETTLQLADGHRAMAHAHVNRTFRAGTSIRTALAEAARSMGLALPPNLNVSKELDGKFDLDETLDGPARDELTRLLAPYGYGWSIQSGRLTILRDEDVTAGQSILVSQDTGMIEQPDYSVPDPPNRRSATSTKPRKKKRPKVTVRTLLYPQVTPGGTIDLRSQSISGVFKVARVGHDGDTHGENWTTEIEANPV